MIQRGRCTPKYDGVVMQPPRSEAELLVRAQTMAGRALDALAAEHGLPYAGHAGTRGKGKTGALVEQLLGATGGSSAQHDFPALAIELKTIPVDARTGRPRESTYVCTLPLADADGAEWSTSWARAKLARVLWVPVVIDEGRVGEAPRVGAPLLWSPTEEQSAVLAGDFDDVMGAIAIGGVEGLTGSVGRWLHARPKAANAREKAWGLGADGEWIATVKRGFYLRERFTGAILRDARALP
jgi:DNA mismatch repair protein MutH